MQEILSFDKNIGKILQNLLIFVNFSGITLMRDG